MNTDYLSVKATRDYEIADRETMYTAEDLEEIWRLAKRCEKCPYPDDCHRPCPFELIERKPEIVDQFKAAHAEGLTDRGLAIKFKTRDHVAAAMITVLGLKKNEYKRQRKNVPPTNPCEKCFSKEICKKHGGTCKARTAWEVEVGL